VLKTLNCFFSGWFERFELFERLERFERFSAVRAEAYLFSTAEKRYFIG
jgi:hypothetical protein